MAAAPKNEGFAHFAGETVEQRDAHLAALDVELASAVDRDEEEHVKAIEAEIARIRPAGKQTR